jgi:hypothetical protein
VVPRNRIRRALIIVFVFLVMNTQPGLFGSFTSELFLLLPMVGLIMAYVFLGNRVVAARSKRVLLGLTAVYVWWTLFQVLILEPDGLYKGVAIAVTIPTVVVGCILLISNLDTALVLKIVIIVVALLSISQLVTYSLIFLGLEESILILEEYWRVGKASPVKLYLPYTFTVHFSRIAGHRVERAVGLYREPGVYQMVTAISYFALDFVQIRRKKLLRVLSLFSLLSTFSTAGYVIFLGCLVYKSLLIRRGRLWLRVVSMVVLAGLFCML